MGGRVDGRRARRLQLQLSLKTHTHTPRRQPHDDHRAWPPFGRHIGGGRQLQLQQQQKNCPPGQVYAPGGDSGPNGCCALAFACGSTCCVTGECDPKTLQCCAKGGVVRTLHGGCCPAERMCSSAGSGGGGGGAFCCPAGTRCFNGACKDTRSFAWLSDCAASQLCGPPQNAACCNDDEVCWQGRRCCARASQCGSSNCCEKGQTCCASSACCDAAKQDCLGGRCVPKGSVVCGRTVCGPDEACLAGNMCCKQGAQLCGGRCCDLAVSTCLSNQCVAAGSTLCNGVICERA